MADERPMGPVIWAHCSDSIMLGAMSDLAHRLQPSHPSVKFVFSADHPILNADVHVSVLDMNIPQNVQDTVSAHSPKLFIWAGGDISVAALNQMHRARCPVALVHPETAEFSKGNWLWRKTTLAPALKACDRIFVDRPEKADVFQSMGARPWRVNLVPHIHSGIAPPPCNEAERDTIATLLAGRPVWYAAEIPKDELDAVVEATKEAQRSWPRLVTIFRPADPNHRDICKSAFQKAGLIVADRAIEGEPNETTQVFMADGPEDDSLWYRISTLAYMGGTLTGKSEMKPLIAASVGCAILHGPNLAEQMATYEPLIQAQAMTTIAHGRQLGSALAALLAPDAAALKAHTAWAFTTHGAEATDEIMEYICDCLNLDPLD